MQIGYTENQMMLICVPENLKQFINFRISRKKRMLIHHFSEYATNRPYIHRCGVVTRTEKYFRCSVPQSHHLKKRRQKKSNEEQDHLLPFQLKSELSEISKEMSYADCCHSSNTNNCEFFELQGTSKPTTPINAPRFIAYL